MLSLITQNISFVDAVRQFAEGAGVIIPSRDAGSLNDPQYKEIIAKLKEEMLSQRKEYNETDVNYPHIQKIIDKHWND